MSNSHESESERMCFLCNEKVPSVLVVMCSYLAFREVDPTWTDAASIPYGKLMLKPQDIVTVIDSIKICGGDLHMLEVIHPRHGIVYIDVCCSAQYHANGMSYLFDEIFCEA